MLLAVSPPESTLSDLFKGRHFRTTHRQAAMPVMTVTKKTVKSLLDTPAYGQYFQLSGRLTRHLGPSRYRFADETGEMTARISLTVSGDISLFKDERIVITGELKRTVSGQHILRVETLERPFFPGSPALQTGSFQP